MPSPTLIATWPLGLRAVEVAVDTLSKDGSALDGVEAGIRAVEADPEVTSVGYGGLPNAAGEVELDAAIMEAFGHRAGAVAGLKRIKHPISVARRVMEMSPHVLLVGEGARSFAADQGFPEEDTLAPQALIRWREWKAGAVTGTSAAPKAPHDTIGLLVLDVQGRLAGGCSTSGMAFKLPGRVGDSPIIGAGLYVDGEEGAAAATGLGEEALQTCLSFRVVELMGRGMAPPRACSEALGQMLQKRPGAAEHQIAVIALSPCGDMGAASVQAGFEYAVWHGGASRLLPAPALVTRRQ